MEIIEQKIERNPLEQKNEEEIKKQEKAKKLTLTQEQEKAYQTIKIKMEKNEYQA